MKKSSHPPKDPNAARSGEEVKPFDPLEFSRKMLALMDKAQPVVQDMVARYQNRIPDPTTVAEHPIDPMHLNRATAEFWGHYMAHPSRLIELQLKYWEDLSHLWSESARKFLGEPSHEVVMPESGDRRFRDPVWTENAVFDFIKQSYLLTRNWVRDALDEAPNMPEEDRQRLEFYTRQFLDALSPTNFALTNPEVIKETLKTGGDNLLKGFNNLIEDIKQGNGDFKIRTTASETFVLGKNLAVTPGKVVFRNRMMELIQYAPSTAQVMEKPLLIVPPWINKYYILDLRAENSFVKFAVDQGFTVFMVSWVNPDRSYARVTFDDYLTDGFLAALKVVEDVTRQKSTHVVGYCIGGTLTSMALAYLAKKRQSSRVASATLLTTLLDFEKAGDMKVFISERQLDEIEAQMKTKGFLEAQALQKTFSILRANDMIWSFVINNYMLGKSPFPFDILYWNEDSTNLPAAFHSYYLRHMYLRNDLIKPDKLTIDGVKVDLTKIRTPLFFLSTREDHIAPWKATFSGAQLLAGKAEVTFVLAASGHVAGVVNPPASGKYSYWVNDDMALDAEGWIDGAKQMPGSWWPKWAEWLKPRMGAMVAPRAPGQHADYPALSNAPGDYVAKRVV